MGVADIEAARRIVELLTKIAPDFAIILKTGCDGDAGEAFGGPQAALPASLRWWFTGTIGPQSRVQLFSRRRRRCSRLRRRMRIRKRMARASAWSSAVRQSVATEATTTGPMPSACSLT